MGGRWYSCFCQSHEERKGWGSCYICPLISGPPLTDHIHTDTHNLPAGIKRLSCTTSDQMPSASTLSDRSGLASLNRYWSCASRWSVMFDTSNIYTKYHWCPHPDTRWLPTTVNNQLHLLRLQNYFCRSPCIIFFSMMPQWILSLEMAFVISRKRSQNLKKTPFVVSRS